MTTEIQKQDQSSGLDIQLIKDTICKGVTQEEFKLFIYWCKKTGLDPMARQIHAVKRWNSKLNRDEMAVQIAIDGFRLIAERTGQYAGQTAPEWCGADGKWVDIWLDSAPPMASRIGVYRKDFAHPVYGVATLASYQDVDKNGKPKFMWGKMPDVMLAKCAESQALRKAFPQELSGLYTADEMGHQPAPAPQDNDAIEYLQSLADAAPEVIAYLRKQYGKNAKAAREWCASMGDDVEAMKQAIAEVQP
jgi:phage recombination protein Bet